MSLDAIESLLHAVEAAALHRYLCLKMRKLRLQVSQIHFQTRHSNFEVRDIGAHFLLTTQEQVLPASQDLELLHDQIGSFVGHKVILAPFSR
jgi:hypothetical protein